MIQSDSGPKTKRFHLTWVGGSFATIAVVLFTSLLVVKPSMPDRIVLLTGPEGSAYHDLGTRYAEDLRRRGLKVDVSVTTGPLDNLGRLAAGGDAIGFAPSTADRWVDEGEDGARLVALGSVGIEPLWVFYRSDIGIARIPDFAGRKVVTGGTGTAGDYLARKLFANNDLDDQVEIRPNDGQEPEELAESLGKGTFDALFVTGSAKSSIVQSMLSASDVGFVHFDRAETYSILIPGVTWLVAPEGIFDIVRNVPQRDTHFLSITTCLVAHEDIHPAVVPMVLQAAENVGENPSAFAGTPAFPGSENLTLPLDPAARRYFSQGEVGLSKFLPYRVTRFLNHIGFLVLPLLTLVFVLLKIVPTVLRIWTGIRLKQLWLRIKDVEKANSAGTDPSRLLADLEQIDRASAGMFVPRSSVQDYIGFRQTLHSVTARVQSRDAESG